jgi:hypothetical protein
MEESKDQRPQVEENSSSSPADTKKRWQEPKLAFVTPTLTKHGDLKGLTTGFVGTFLSPEEPK